MKKISHLNRQNLKLLAVCLGVGLIGVTLLNISNAATPSAALETENGTISAPATSVSDASASGGAAVKFSAGSGSGVELTGWQLTTTNVGLAPFGLSCTSLPAYTGVSKPASGTTITGKLISTGLDLSNGNITITRSCIRPTTFDLALLLTSDYNGCGNSCPTPAKGPITVTDSEIDGSLMSAQSVSQACAFLGVGDVQRNYMHDTGSGICFFGTGNTQPASAINNYVDRMRAYGNPATTGSHNETFTIRDYTTSSQPTRSLAVRGNYFNINSGNDTGAIFIQAYGGFIDNVTISNNLLAGNGYQLILEANSNGYGTHMVATNNRLSGTGYGAGYVTGGPGWATWTNNYINDPTKTDNKGAVITKP